MSLTEMVIMPGKDYQNICDSVRNLLPNIDHPITSDMVSPLINSVDNMDWLITDESKDVYQNDRIFKIRPYGFSDATTPTVAIFPNVAWIGYGAFVSNNGIEEVYLPSLIETEYNAFSTAVNLRFAHLGQIAKLRSGTFGGAANLNSVVLANSNSVVPLESIQAFAETPYIKSVDAFKYPLPTELIDDLHDNNVNYVYVNDYYGKDVSQNWDGGAMSIVEDDTSTTGKVLKIVANTAGNPGTFDLQQTDGYLYLHQNGVLGKIPYANIKANEGKGYHLYKCSDIVVPNNVVGTYNYFWMFSWYLKHYSMGAKLKTLEGKTVDMYIYMKVEGEIDDPNTVTWYFDRFFIVEKPEDPTIAVTPKIYVPEALIEEYKTATNWCTLYSYGNCEFVALEGSEYE